MQKDYSKHMKKKLRELAAVAYDRELGRHLEELRLCFVDWSEHKISSHDLSDRIHLYHDGTSRDLYSLNQQFKPDFLVARAIALGVLTDDEVPSDVREVLSTRIETLKSLLEDESTA